MSEKLQNHQLFFDLSRRTETKETAWIEKWLQSGKIVMLAGLETELLNFSPTQANNHYLISKKIVSGVNLQNNGFFACINLIDVLYKKEHELLRILFRYNPNPELLPLVLLKKILVDNDTDSASEIIDNYWGKNKKLKEDGLLILLTESVLMNQKEKSFARFRELEPAFSFENIRKAIFIHNCYGNQKIASEILNSAESGNKDIEDCIQLAEAFLNTINDLAKAKKWIEEAEKRVNHPEEWFWLAEVWKDLQESSAAENRCRRLGHISERLFQSKSLRVSGNNEYQHELEEIEKTAIYFNTWLNLAMEWQEKADAPMRSIRCLIKAEEQADRFTHWTECARLWFEMFNQKKEASHCLNTAGIYAFDNERKTALKKFFNKYADAGFQECNSIIMIREEKSDTGGPNIFPKDNPGATRFYRWNKHYLVRHIRALEKDSLAFNNETTETGAIKHDFLFDYLLPNDTLLDGGRKIAGFFDHHLGLIYRSGISKELKRMIGARPFFKQEYDITYHWYLWLMGMNKEAIDIFEKEIKKGKDLYLNHYFFIHDILNDAKRSEQYLEYLTKDIINNNTDIWKKQVLVDYAKIWILDFQNYTLAEQCLSNALQYKNSEILCTWAEFFLNLMDDDSKAYEFLSNAISLAKTDSDWIICAQYHIFLFNDRLCARYALQKAEKSAKNTFDMVQVAKEWMLLFDDKDRALKCLKKASHLRDESDDDFDTFYLNEESINILGALNYDLT